MMKEFLAANALVTSAVLDLGGTAGVPAISIADGNGLGTTIDFLIVALIVFWFAKKVLREEQVAKK